MVDDLKEREAKLEATNRKMNQRVLELEHGLGQSVPRIPGSREELELKLDDIHIFSTIFIVNKDNQINSNIIPCKFIYMP